MKPISATYDVTTDKYVIEFKDVCIQLSPKEWDRLENMVFHVEIQRMHIIREQHSTESNLIENGTEEDAELTRLVADITEVGYHDEQGRLILPKGERDAQ